jgi:hypothetical protein
MMRVRISPASISNWSRLIPLMSWGVFNVSKKVVIISILFKKDVSRNQEGRFPPVSWPRKNRNCGALNH